MTELTCVTNEGYVSAAQSQADAIMEQAIVETVIQAAMALWQRNTSRTIAAQQEEIANRHIQLAEAIQAHAEKFWPEELRLVNDVMGEARPSNSSMSGALTASNNTMLLWPQSRSLVERASADQCMPIGSAYKRRMLNHLRREATDVSSHWAREAVHINDTLSDRRYGRQYQVLQAGRGLIGDVVSYSNLGGSAGIMAGGMLEGTIDSIIGAVGYSSTANGTGQWGSAIREALTGPAPADTSAQAELRKETIARSQASVNYAPRNY